MVKQPCVYILASGKHGTLYIGVTSDLMVRLYQHREGLIEGFTSRYGVYRLVWFEMADTMKAVITREKQLKKWNRDWKLRLIEEGNPGWVDLSINLGFEPIEKTAGMDSRLRGNDGIVTDDRD
ncbi:GIY-YIG nuclease family protein [Sphingomonas sp. CCH5-D11]|uniref:GIY-YIG nuclease family protein n=1 Tax=Sphingomonas sp. CCH5-D11 TaxID=1768786 RepID=UPI0008345308|nr:GIY-YIG nuclease family protein [Sphingomonas sp. CCH5-D11]